MSAIRLDLGVVQRLLSSSQRSYLGNIRIGGGEKKLAGSAVVHRHYDQIESRNAESISKQRLQVSLPLSIVRMHATDTAGTSRDDSQAFIAPSKF